MTSAHIQWYKSLDSTNNEARRQIDTLDNLSVIAAFGQNAGRGQGSHTWHTTPGKNITATIVLKPENLAARDAILLTQITTLALRAYLHSRGVEARIKWPNDIWVDSRKICGILIENTLDGAMVQSSIIGIGLNINEENWPEHLPNPVSLKELTGKEYSVEEELEGLMKEFCRHAEMISSEDGRKYLESEFANNVFRLPEELERQYEALKR